MAIVVKLFILGLPGSGKSAIARFILDYMNGQQIDQRDGQQWSAIRFNDYEILLDMFQQDAEGKRFKPAKPGGFDVTDLKAFDDALVTLKQRVNTYIASLKSDEKKLIIIEFSRNDYEKAFQLFKSTFFKDAYILYLDTILEKCRERVNYRAAHPTSEKDDYPVSDYIFEEYYCKDNWTEVRDDLAKNCEVKNESIWTFYNDHSYEIACLEIRPYVDKMIDSASRGLSDKHEGSPEELAPDKNAGNENQEPITGKEQPIDEKELAEIGS